METTKEFQNSDSKKETGEESQTSGTNDEETEEEKANQQEQEVNWKEKFSNSFKEVERYRKEILPNLQYQIEEEKERRQKLEREQEDLLKSLEETNPDAKRLLDMEKSVKELRQETLLAKEMAELTNFIYQVPQAERFKEIIRNLGRTNPKKSYSEIWEGMVSPTLEGLKTDFFESEKIEKKTQIETGKGSRSKEDTGEIDLKEFNKLSLEKQKQLLKRALGEKTL